MGDWTIAAKRMTKRLKTMNLAELKKLARDPEQVAILRSLEAEIDSVIGDLARAAHNEDEGIPVVWCDSATYMAHLQRIWAEQDAKTAGNAPALSCQAEPTR